MSAEQVFSSRLLVGWIAGAVAAFAVALYFVGGGELDGPDSLQANTFSRSAIGHAGFAEVLTQLGIPVAKSRSSSPEKVTAGGVLVIAEPLQSPQIEAVIGPLLETKTILLVLPKWLGLQGGEKTGWVGSVAELPPGNAKWALDLVAPGGDVTRESSAVTWTTNALNIIPSIELPLQLIHSSRLRQVIAAPQGILVGEISGSGRKIWVLADPDVINNHGLSHPENAALAVALIKALRSGEGNVVFDETVHGFTVRTANALQLLFRFPFVVATIQGLLAVLLLMWATLGRFGAPRSAPPTLSAGREGLLQNMAKLVEFTGHQDMMVKRYVEETIRDVAATLHAPRDLSIKNRIAWLKRVGLARGTTIDFDALLQRAADGSRTGLRHPSALLRLARDTHQWKREIVDGRARHPGGH
ncbi:MAG TPA: DUF4350 domain-containing protein [Xanthobacteraceae bacterium]|jgi:hypothetical protein|nr:DUF4350 domain-containing protein [Xanthobacteraceae bacterium]